MGLQHGFIAQQNVQKCKLRNVLANDDQQHGQGRRKQEANRSPQPGPEDGRKNYSDRCQSSSMAIKLRLEKLADDNLNSEEHAQRVKKVPVVRENRQTKEQRERGANPRAQVGNESQQPRQQSP